MNEGETMKNTKTVNIIKLVVSIVACQCADIIGSVFTSPAIPAWYATLQKPAFTSSPAYHQ